jgi:hypothetical protein
MKIVTRFDVKSKNTNCIFCKKKLNGNHFFEFTLKESAGIEGGQSIFSVHLSCAYNQLKKYKNPTEEVKKIISELEDRYSKEMVMENLK